MASTLLGGRQLRRLSLSALALVLSAGCGSPAAPVTPAAVAGACAPAELTACEGKLAAAFAAGRFDRAPVDAADRELVSAYVKGRAARDAADPWARVHRAFGAKAVLVIGEGAAAEAARAAARSAGDTVAFFDVSALPEPTGLSSSELLAAMGAAAGASLVVRARPAASGVRVEEILAADPLSPFMAGVAPVVRDDGALAHLGADVSLEASIRRAFGYASALRYVEAAHEAERLEAAVAGRDPASEPSLRARYALDLLQSAGLTLDRAAPTDDAAKAPLSPPTEAETAYGALLRVRTAKDERAAWPSRSSLVLAHLPPARQAMLGALFEDAACSTKPLPPIEGPRELALASRLAGSLAREPDDEARGRLPLGAWLPRYEAALTAVERAGAAWSLLPSLLAERGEVHGLRPNATAAYRRATELGSKHLSALAALQHAEPDRFRAMAAIPLAYALGVLGDDALRGPLMRLLQASVTDKIARAPDPAGIFEGLVAGAFAGMSYPPALRTEQLLAVQGAFAARLRGDLSQRTGWAVAGLFAADAGLRAVTKDRSGLGASALHVARALEDDRALPRPALGALAASGARYAALSMSGQLDPTWRPAGPILADRRAARDALRKAIAGLGEPGEAPNNVLDDVAELADGVIAAVAATLGDARAPSSAAAGPAPKTARAAKGPTCDAKAPLLMTPTVRRTFAKLGDVRLRILGHPRFKAGDGAWVRRARLLVALLSDAMDIATRQGPRPVFTLPTADVERFAADALREWEPRAAADATASAYALGRDYLAAERAEPFLAASGPRMRKTLGGLLGWFRGDGTSAGIALIDALAAIKLPSESAATADAPRALLAYAKAFRERGQADQADLCLLGTLLLSTIAHAPPSPASIDLAAAQKSRVEWALRFAADAESVRHGAPPNPASYAPGVKAAEIAACAVADVDTPVAVMEAIRAYGAGKRVDARRSLDELLTRMETKGLALPLVTYRYEERTATKVLALSLGVSLGAGLIEGSSSFQLGFGVRSGGPPEGALTTTFDAPGGAQAGAEATRYYVYASALAAAYHFLDGDRDHATRAAHRAIAAVVGGARLGDRRVAADSPIAAASSARELLALDAQLAAEAGLPFLAGDLWTIVRGALPEDADDAAIAGLLTPLPVGVLGLPDAAAASVRARPALRMLAEPLACTEAKVDASSFEHPACESYPLALSLRIADAVKKLPRLARGSAAERECGPVRALDAFLAGADKGNYDPDAFTRAVEALHADGRAYEAAVLLTRHRREGHCSPALSNLARGLGRSPLLGPSVRADLLSVAVNCAAAAPDARFEDDVASLDAETRALPDPSRNFRLALFVTDLSLRSSRFDLLARLAAQPGFVDRWAQLDPTAATAALVIDHAALVLTGKLIAPDAQRTSYELACETFPPGERARRCEALRTLRAGATSQKDRERIAREALTALVASGDGRR